jgi:AcrR family transcriptional regulator
VTLQRARSDEQREVRRRAILDAAAAMLDEMRWRRVSLNELSRRVGLAKSNVLRYFESREAVLFELALWAYARPSASTLAAYDVDPTLADLRLDLPAAMEDALAMLISGAFARSAG